MWCGEWISYDGTERKHADGGAAAVPNAGDPIITAASSRHSEANIASTSHASLATQLQFPTVCRLPRWSLLRGLGLPNGLPPVVPEDGISEALYKLTEERGGLSESTVVHNPTGLLTLLTNHWGGGIFFRGTALLPRLSKIVKFWILQSGVAYVLTKSAAWQWYELGDPGLEFGQRQHIFLLSKPSIPALVPNHFSLRWVPGPLPGGKAAKARSWPLDATSPRG